MSEKDNNREEWIMCVARTHADHLKKTWCGARRTLKEFTSVDHAAENGLAQGRYVVCQECYAAIIKALSNGLEEIT